MMGHSVEYALNRANKALKKGANTEAEKIFKSVLEVYPGNKRAQDGLSKLHQPQKRMAAPNVSLIQNLYEKGEYHDAIHEAVKILNDFPNYAHALNLKGASHGKLGELDEALSCFELVKKYSKSKASANNNIGSVWREKGNLERAVKFYEEALSENPVFFDALKNLGATFHRLEENDRALVYFQKALKIKPDDVEILNANASLYKDLNQSEIAISLYRKILKIDGENFRVWNNLGNIYLGKRELEDAVSCYEKALKINPEYSDAMNNLANALKDMDYLDEAIFYYDQALKAPNAKIELYSNYGVALKDRGFFEKAMEMLNIALEKRNYYPDAEWNKALVHLAKGDFGSGWDAYDWRWKATNFDSKPLVTSKPYWDGKKERVLIWPEQGLGDQIMFSTLFSEFAKLCETPIFQIDPRLLGLFRRTYPEIYFIPSDKSLAENEYDSHIPMGSLAKYLRRSANDFSDAEQTALKADENVTQNIKQAFRLGNKKLIGISWKSKNSDSGFRRSLELEKLLSIFKGSDCEIVSLQYGDTKKEIKDAYSNTGVAVKTVDQIDTFFHIDKLASLIACCDEVVTIDNSTVHLAGAMGVRTHLLLPFVCDWRWFAHEHGSLWYRDLNIYKKNEVQNWEDIFPDLISNLKSL